MEGSDIEDGELLESDNETGEKTTQPLPQPSQSQGPSFQSAWSSHRGGGDQSSFAYRAPKAPGLSSDDEDSEEEHGTSPRKMFKQRRTQGPGGSTTDNQPFNNPLAAGARRGLDANMWQPMVEESKAKKRNNIWSNVMEDQTLSATIGNVAMDRGDICVERDVESYDVHSKYLAKYLHGDEDSNDSHSRATDGSERDCEEDMKEDKGLDSMFDDANTGEDMCAKESFAAGLPKPKKKGIKSRLGQRVVDDDSSQSSFGNSRPNTPCEPIEGPVGLCDMESFGTEAADKVRKTIKERLGCRDSMDTDDSQRHNRKRSHKKSRASAKDRLGSRSFDKRKLRPHIKVSADDTPEKIAIGIMQTLSEPEHMAETFLRVVGVLGGQKALELLYMTEDVEEAGGMMTMRGDRRRTPGGVYLQLLKEDKSVSPVDHAQIFIDQREKQKKDKKDRQRRQRERTKMEREARLREMGQHPNAGLSALPDKREVMEPVLDPRAMDPRAVTMHEDNAFDDDLHCDTEGIMLEAV